eukprot:364068-Chlamydomonas_euryale.AAC.8
MESRIRTLNPEPSRRSTSCEHSLRRGRRSWRWQCLSPINFVSTVPYKFLVCACLCRHGSAGLASTLRGWPVSGAVLTWLAVEALSRRPKKRARSRWSAVGREHCATASPGGLRCTSPGEDLVFGAGAGQLEKRCAGAGCFAQAAVLCAQCCAAQ